MTNVMMEADSSLRLEDRPGLAPTIHDFDIMKPISRGAFGKVFLCHRKDAPDKTLAVKVMKKSELVQKNMVDQVRKRHPTKGVFIIFFSSGQSGAKCPCHHQESVRSGAAVLSADCQQRLPGDGVHDWWGPQVSPLNVRLPGGGPCRVLLC